MMGFALLEYLTEKGYLTKGSRLLDVGSQNLLNCTLEGMTQFAERFRDAPLSNVDRKEIARQFYFSTPRPGERTLFVGEYLELTDISYRGIDVCPAPFTDIVDLNRETVPADQRQSYDVVLNLGTTEHIVGQINAHRYIHDALKVGGIALHQPPSVGWCNHGYYAYHPRFYRDLAEANGYEILDIWYSQSGEGLSLDTDLPARPAIDPLGEDQRAPEMIVPWYNLNVVMRKTTDRPFQLKLELATSHSAVDGGVDEQYRGGELDALEAGTPSGAAARRSRSPSVDQLAAKDLTKILLQRVHNRLLGRKPK